MEHEILLILVGVMAGIFGQMFSTRGERKDLMDIKVKLAEILTKLSGYEDLENKVEALGLQFAELVGEHKTNHSPIPRNSNRNRSGNG